MIIEITDYIDACTPFRNGCSFRLVKDNGNFYLEAGCYCLYNLISGSELYILGLINMNNGKLFITDEKVISSLMAIKPCERCGGFKQKSS